MNKIKRIAYYLSGLAPLTVPMFAQAQFTAPNTNAFQSLTSFQQFICTTVVNWLFTFVVILAIVFVLIAAFKYLTAAGDPEKVKSASHNLIYAAVAVVVALLARGMPLLIGSLFGQSGFQC